MMLCLYNLNYDLLKIVFLEESFTSGQKLKSFVLRLAFIFLLMEIALPMMEALFLLY